jgi:hypothetical protein
MGNRRVHPNDLLPMCRVAQCPHGDFSNGLLFHELVHVEQYRQLGIPRFSELCVRGFLNGGSYEAIPLEVSAYTLEG